MPVWVMPMIQFVLTLLEAAIGKVLPGPVATPTTMEEHVRNAQYSLDQAMKVMAPAPLTHLQSARLVQASVTPAPAIDAESAARITAVETVMAEEKEPEKI